MIRSYKVMLHPNNKQRTKMFQTAGACRFIYNWTSDIQNRSYKENKGFISEYDMMLKFTILRRSNEYKWLRKVSRDAVAHTIKDACNAYKNFFNGYNKYPKFKSKKKTKPSFYIHNSHIKITNTHVKLEKISNNQKSNRLKINWVKLARKNHIPLGVKYHDPRITFDGLNWWLTIGVDIDQKEVVLEDDGVGVYSDYKDNLITTSSNDRYKSINKDKEIVRLECKIKSIQQILARQYEMNKQGNRYIKTNNILKNEKKLLKCYKRITNIRNNYLHMISRDIINRKPKFIVMKKPNMNNKLSRSNKNIKSIHQASIYKLSQYIIYKAQEYDIPVYIIDNYLEISLCPKCNLFRTYDDIKDIFINKSKCSRCNSTIDYQLYNANNLKKCVDNNSNKVLAFTIDNQYNTNADIVVGECLCNVGIKHKFLNNFISF